MSGEGPGVTLLFCLTRKAMQERAFTLRESVSEVSQPTWNRGGEQTMGKDRERSLMYDETLRQSCIYVWMHLCKSFVPKV